MSAGLHPVIMHDLASSRMAEEHRRAVRSRARRAAGRRVSSARQGR